MTVHFAGRSAAVVSATLEIFHLYSPRPGWVLDAALEGPIGRLWLAGTADTEAPRRLELEYIDAPAIVTVGDRPGSLVVGGGGPLVVSDLGAGLARVAGTLALRWTSGESERAYEIAVDLVAALVT